LKSLQNSSSVHLFTTLTGCGGELNGELPLFTTTVHQRTDSIPLCSKALRISVHQLVHQRTREGNFLLVHQFVHQLL
jgi:hypothetical protein